MKKEEEEEKEADGRGAARRRTKGEEGGEARGGRRGDEAATEEEDMSKTGDTSGRSHYLCWLIGRLSRRCLSFRPSRLLTSSGSWLACLLLFPQVLFRASCYHHL